MREHQYINGCDLTGSQHDQVVAAFGYDGRIDNFWLERHDFAFTLNGEALIYFADPIENIQIALQQDAEREQIAEDERRFPHLDR